MTIHKFTEDFNQLNIEIKNEIVEQVFINTLYYPYISYNDLLKSNFEFNFNYGIYKSNEMINSIFLSLNNFLIQTYMILNGKASIMEIDDIDTGKDIIKDYRKHFSRGNKNNLNSLFQEIEYITNINFSEEKKFFKMIEILIRNNFSHGFHLLLENIYQNHASGRQVPEFKIFINKDYLDCNLLLLKIKKTEAVSNLISKLNGQGNIEVIFDKNNFAKTMSDKSKDKKSIFFQDERIAIFNENALRVFLSRNYFNRYTFKNKGFKITDAKIILANKCILTDKKYGQTELSVLESIKNANNIIRKIDDFFHHKKIKF